MISIMLELVLTAKIEKAALKRLFKKI